MTVAASWEVRFTRPGEWLRELWRDMRDDYVADRIVRVSLAEGAATLNLVYAHALPGGDRITPVARARWLEASYISGRNQLVRLNHYLGWRWDLEARIAGDEPRRPKGDRLSHNAAQLLDETDTIRKLFVELTAHEEIDLRAGDLALEDGWRPAPDADIATPAGYEDPGLALAAELGQVTWVRELTWRIGSGTVVGQSYLVELAGDLSFGVCDCLRSRNGSNQCKHVERARAAEIARRAALKEAS